MHLFFIEYNGNGIGLGTLDGDLFCDIKPLAYVQGFDSLLIAQLALSCLSVICSIPESEFSIKEVFYNV
jgi:hypothetical protein